MDSKAEALVNTVNTVGVMGKGIALQFKEAFLTNTKKYTEVCKAGNFNIGDLLIVRDHNTTVGTKIIVNFPTKKHWRHPSKYEYVEAGLKKLIEVIETENIKSIALPPLGCGNGGLDWEVVREMIEQHLGKLNVDVFVYKPNDAVKAILQKENAIKQVKLTPFKAQLLYLLFYYEGVGEYSSLFSANKLAYFLRRMGDKDAPVFIAHHYGPYSVKIEHALYALNGTYIKGYEQKQAKAFESLKLNYHKFDELKAYIKKELDPIKRQRLNNLFNLIEGYQSELSLEILASVDFILSQNPSYSEQEVFSEIQKWNERKKRLFKKEYVSASYRHLMSYRNILS